MIMKLITEQNGKRKGIKGVTIHILKQGSMERSRTITIHGLTIQQVHEKLKFFFNALKESTKGIDIIIK